LEAATFSGEVLDIAEKECLSVDPDSTAWNSRATTFAGAPASTFEFGDGGLGNSMVGRGYRIYHKERCYQLGVAIGTGTVAAYDPSVRDLSESDVKEIKAKLEQARESFRFLK
jgi:hypothetical protein